MTNRHGILILPTEKGCDISAAKYGPTIAAAKKRNRIVKYSNNPFNGVIGVKDAQPAR